MKQSRLKITDKIGNLDSFLRAKELRFQDEPFRHAIIDDFFPEQIYDRLCEEFDKKLTHGLSEKYSKDCFYRQGHYDAYAWILDPEFSEYWNFFYSFEWYSFLKNSFQLPILTNTRVALHHHKSFGASGTIHNDYNLTNFVLEPLENGVNPWFHQCIYMRARVTHPRVQHNCRSIAVLYYLANSKNWAPTDGGETGLYQDPLVNDNPVIKIAPLNNRLVVFEVSPLSYHCYLRNGPTPRNVLAQWFHVLERDAILLYGKEPT